MFKNIIVAPRLIDPQNDPQTAYLTTYIYPVREGLSVLLTNSVNGLRVDAWLIFECHTKLNGEFMQACLMFVDTSHQLDKAFRLARQYARNVYKVDIWDANSPF